MKNQNSLEQIEIKQFIQERNGKLVIPQRTLNNARLHALNIGKMNGA